MAEKFEEIAVVVDQNALGSGIYDLTLKTKNIAKAAKAGQFVSVYSNDRSKLLPRPISLCGIDRDEDTIRLVYRVTGENTGTEEFSRLHPGIQVEAMGPLGNGFPLEEAEGKKVFLIGGGIGIPPMLQTAKELKAEKTAVLGYRDELFLNDEFEKYADVYVATEDGSAGTKGNVLNAIKEKALEAEGIFACGPTPMLRALKEYAAEKNITCWISMEERMACGVGACLACVCRSKEIDAHSQVHNKRVCKDGPVFLSTEVEL